MTNPYHVDESKPWFKDGSGWPEDVPKNFEFEEMTLGQMLANAAERWPDRKAMHFHTPTLDVTMTYRELDRHVSAFATGLHKLGLKKGDVIALALPNSFQFVIAYYGANRIGCVPTGVNPTYQPIEVKHQLKLTGAKALVCLDALYETMVAPIIDDTDVEKLIVTNIVDLAGLGAIKKFLGKLLKKIPSGPTPATAIQFLDLLDTTPAVPAVTIEPKVDPAAYLMTGGTTGVPKAAVLTHFNLVSNATQCRLWLTKVGEGTALIGVLPLFHSFAMTAVMNVAVNIGGWMLLFPRPPEDYEDLFKVIVNHAPKEGMFLPGAEVLFQKILKHPKIKEYDFVDKLTLAISGAGPLHDYVQQPFEEITKAKLVEGYGLTESSPVISAAPLFGQRMIGKIGLPFPGTDWCLMDVETGTKKVEELGEEHPGEIWAAGPQIMKGYLNADEETAAEITEMDGKRWLHTGDIGYWDELGRITICDRKKQLIKHRGFSVFPKDVESLLGMHEAVSEAAVAGLPDPEGKVGEIIKAWVVLKDDHKGKVKAEELIAWAKDNITHYKVPAQIEFRDELPKTLVGKILRRKLQEADPLFKKKEKKEKKAE
jgi:long-chain acyl-CoA synthetase